jgi:hypothetical protein
MHKSLVKDERHHEAVWFILPTKSPGRLSDIIKRYLLKKMGQMMKTFAQIMHERVVLTRMLRNGASHAVDDDSK